MNSRQSEDRLRAELDREKMDFFDRLKKKSEEFELKEKDTLSSLSKQHAFDIERYHSLI